MGTIYLTTSNNVVTGGVEATYQLYYILKRLGFNSKLLLLNPQIHPQFHPDWLDLHKQSFTKNYPDVYKKYQIDINDLVYEVEDNSNNFFLAPEIYPDMLCKFKNIQKGIWWLSVDNGLGQDQRNFMLERNTSDIWHFYQSEYAHWFLINNGVSKMAKLTDFISWEYRNLDVDFSRKENIILYNPKKGIEITQQLIQSNSEFEFIPIQNMSPNQIKELMFKSKIYIDFGTHPGKDRIPREAALCGCCVITGFKGSAMFFDDVNIFEQYKFEEDLSNFSSLIEDIFNNFEIHHNQFLFYRKQIELEEEQFKLEIKKIF
jgi:hypothetical protein